VARTERDADGAARVGRDVSETMGEAATGIGAVTVGTEMGRRATAAAARRGSRVKRTATRRAQAARAARVFLI